MRPGQMTNVAAMGSAPALFDFTPASLPSGATLTRASAGTRLNVSGTLVSETTNVARFEYNAAHTLLGLLYEPAATNLLIKSEQLNDAAWTAAGVVVTADSTAAPDGNTTADFVKEDGTTGGHAIQFPSITTSAGTYILSIFAKVSTRSRFLLYGLNGDGKGRGFDLSNGTTFTVSGITDASAYGIQDMGGGWYRCWVAIVMGGGTATQGAAYLVSGTTISYAGDNTSGLYLWGAQTEVGAVLTSYIATTTAAVARATDALTLNWGGKGIADGAINVLYTFDDNSTQTVGATVASGNAVVPTNLNRRWIKQALKV